MRNFLLLCLLVAGACEAQGQPGGAKPPKCQGAAGGIKWSVKLLEHRILRFTIDASLVDTCTVYSDLEFLVTLLAAGGQVVATKRFALPEVVVRGPSVRSYDFQDASVMFAGVKGVALNGKERKLGGLPEIGQDDPLLQEVYRLTKAFETEKKTYSEWLPFGQADYYEIYTVGSNGKLCGSGSFSQGGIQGNPSTCVEAARAGTEALQRRKELYGEAISGPVQSTGL